MGVVYKARDSRLERLVALKFLPLEMSGDSDANDRFMQEARAASALEHSNICTVFDIGKTDDGRLFIVMPFYDGQTLKYRMKDGPLPPERCVDVAIQIARGLARAHEAGIVHRDIKPANIMLTDRGEVKLLDFGVAKLEQGIDLTRTGTTLGTVWYMSPEQARGDQVDGRSDLWSLGVVLFEMLTGRRPFTGDYDQAVVYGILNNEPAAVKDVDASIPGWINDVVTRLLAKDRDERFQTIDELLAALEGSDGAPAQASVAGASRGAGTPRAETPGPGPQGSETRNGEQPTSTKPKWPVWAAIASVIGIAALGAYLILGNQPQPASTDISQTADAAQPTDVARLAVLPFSNLRSDPETDYLGYAMADQVIGSLEYIRNLTVRPSNSVRKYQHGAYDLSEVSRELEVDFVLAGNYLKQNDQMRLTVELIDLSNDETVWREPIEVAYQDAFEMQDLVSERLLKRLQVSFSEDERSRMQADVSADPLAYEYYLRSLAHPEDEAGNTIAIELLEKSIELDSTYAPTWVALGRRQHLQGYWALEGEEMTNRSRRSYQRALDLNPELINALARVSLLYTDSGETDKAIELARRTLEVNPNSAEGHFAYGYVLRYAGMIEESARQMDLALDKDPTNPIFRSAGWTYFQAGRDEDAIAAFYLGTPEVGIAWEGEIARRRGDLDEARSKLDQAIAIDPDGTLGLWSIGILASIDGDHARGIEAARKWEDAALIDGEGLYYLAGIYCLNGAIDECISVLNRAVDGGWFSYPTLLKSSFLDAARGDPDFEALLEKARRRHEAFKAKYFGGGDS